MLYTGEHDTCAECGAEVWNYVHSEAGPIKATAWTTEGPESETDPRYGTRCPNTVGRHVPEAEATAWERDVEECFANGGGWDD